MLTPLHMIKMSRLEKVVINVLWSRLAFTAWYRPSNLGSACSLAIRQGCNLVLLIERPISFLT